MGAANMSEAIDEPSALSMDAATSAKGNGKGASHGVTAMPFEPSSVAADEDSIGGLIDWTTFWDRDQDGAEWVYPDVLARGRGHALYAARKDGKSLLMLFVAVQLATGDEPIIVNYLDYEMTLADVQDRLEDMGYGPAHDLSRFHYHLLPTLPPLDTSEGAQML